MFQLAVQDLPNAPTSVPSSNENEDIFDLPDVPTKTPVAPDAVADNAEVSLKKKGISLSLSHTHTHRSTHLIQLNFKCATFFLEHSYGGAIGSMILNTLFGLVKLFAKFNEPSLGSFLQHIYYLYFALTKFV